MNDSHIRERESGRKCSRTGCITCRIRRVKCDESKPFCLRCLRSRRDCDGYSSLPFSRRDFLAAKSILSAGTVAAATDCAPAQPVDLSLDRPLSPNPMMTPLLHYTGFSSVLYQRCLTFFRRTTVPDSNSFVDCQFWTAVVPQVCRRNPVARSLAAALGALHSRHSSESDDQTSAAQLAFASKHYQEALSQARSQLIDKEANFDDIVTTCVMFSMYCTTRNDFESSDLHLYHGLAIASQHAGQCHQFSANLREASMLLKRLDSASICATAAGWSPLYHLRDRPTFQITLSPTIDGFQQIADARSILVDLIGQYSLIKANLASAIQREDTVSVKAERAKERSLTMQSQLWRRQFHLMMVRNRYKMDAPLTVLYMWWLNCDVALRLSSWGAETRYDAAQRCMAEICMLAQQALESVTRSSATGKPVSSLDIGCIPSLYFVATKCRDRAIRNRSIRLLRTYHRREGQLDSLEAAAVAARWQKIEETNSKDSVEEGHIPEQHRVKSIDVVTGHGKTTLRLHITMASLDHNHCGGFSWEEDLKIMRSRAQYLRNLLSD